MPCLEEEACVIEGGSSSGWIVARGIKLMARGIGLDPEAKWFSVSDGVGCC